MGLQMTFWAVIGLVTFAGVLAQFTAKNDDQKRQLFALLAGGFVLTLAGFVAGSWHEKSQLVPHQAAYPQVKQDEEPVPAPAPPAPMAGYPRTFAYPPSHQ